MRAAEQQARERHGRDRRRIVTSLEQRCDPFLTYAIELLLRERGPQCDVGHDREGVGQSCHGDIHTDGRGVEGAAGRQVASEDVDGVGDLQSGPWPGALVQHGGRQTANAELAWRVVAAASEDEQVDLDERHLVRFDQPHRKAVGEHALLDRRQRDARRRAERRRPGAVGSNLREERRRNHVTQDSQHAREVQPAESERHFCPSGSTISSTRRSAGSQPTTAA